MVDPDGRPRRVGSTDRQGDRTLRIAVVGKDDAASWWTGRIDADRVQLPQTITRRETAELLAAEALTAAGGSVRWRPIENRANHMWDSALLAVHSRHFRPLTAARRPFRVVAV